MHTHWILILCLYKKWISVLVSVIPQSKGSKGCIVESFCSSKPFSGYCDMYVEVSIFTYIVLEIGEYDTFASYICNNAEHHKLNFHMEKKILHCF